MEAVLAKLFSALGTEEMFRVPGLVQRCHTFVQNRTIAVGTSRGKDIVVVCLAIRFAVSLKEGFCTQFSAAMVAREMLRVPGLAHRSHHLTDNWLIAGSTMTLGRSGHSLLAHIGLQGAEHRI